MLWEVYGESDRELFAINMLLWKVQFNLGKPFLYR